jgi:hypothetical protein
MRQLFTQGGLKSREGDGSGLFEHGTEPDNEGGRETLLMRKRRDCPVPALKKRIRKMVKAVVVPVGRALVFERCAEEWKERTGCYVWQIQLKRTVRAK